MAARRGVKRIAVPDDHAPAAALPPVTVRQYLPASPLV
jgi:hypothetical protein